MNTKCDRQIVKQSKHINVLNSHFFPNLCLAIHVNIITVTIPGKKYIKAVTNSTTQNVGSLS